MKKGDLVSVRYITGTYEDATDTRELSKPYVGVVVGSPSDAGETHWRMWCFKRAAIHSIVPTLDTIEVIGENR